MELVLTSSQPVTLLGGGCADEAALQAALAHGPELVCADGGADVARALGIRPNAVVGDFDSISPNARSAFADVLHHRPDQDSTDFEKVIAATEAPLLLALGFLGGRLDHHLASLSAVLKAHRPVILLSADELAFLAPARATLHLTAGMPIGFYPLLPCRLSTAGVQYSLASAPVAPDGLISTSNRMVDNTLTIETDRRAVLVTLPLGALDAVVSALAPPAAPAR
ncbi:MAG: thiamine diphosphokinase [Shimia sp.]